MISIISLLLLTCWGLMILAFYLEENFLAIFGSMGIILFGVYIMVNGLEGINNFLTQGMAFIHLGLGIMVFIIAGYKLYEDW